MNRRTRGFTLTEVAISLAILAMALSVVVASISGSSAGELRAAAARVATIIRATYDQAVLSGRIHRMVFEFTSTGRGEPARPASIYVEVTDEKLQFDEGAEVLARALPRGGSIGGWASLSQSLAFNAADEDQTSGSDSFLPGGIDQLLGISTRSNDDGELEERSVDSVFKKVAEPFVLEDGLTIKDVWNAELGDTVDEGKAYLYFFPHGGVQEALIHLGFVGNDDSDASFTVAIEPLTGRAIVRQEYVEPPK